MTNIWYPNNAETPVPVCALPSFLVVKLRNGNVRIADLITVDERFRLQDGETIDPNDVTHWLEIPIIPA